MDKKKKVIIITSIVAVIVVIFFGVLSTIKIIQNKNMKKEDLYIVISQKDENGEDKVIYRELFTYELVYNEVIKSKIRKNGSNEVIIKDGKCHLINTNCPTHSCEAYEITKSAGIFNNNTTISCLPNGLFIYLERTTE